MARPRSVNRKIPDLPRGMRKIGKSWYWRGTDQLTKEIQERLYEAAGPVLRCMLEISSQTGARIGMIRDIRIGDFDEKRIVLRVTKKRNDRGFESKSYDMTPDLWSALHKGLELRRHNRGGAASLPSDYLFITKHGKPYTKESFKTLWKTARSKLGLEPREITFHDMRAKAASDAESDGAAQELLHHKDPKITKRVYRRKIPTSTPLPSAIKCRSSDLI